MSRLRAPAVRAGTIASILACVVGLCLWPAESSAQNARAAKSVDSVRADLDSSVSPCKDFYRYANGGWYKRIPEGSASSFSEMSNRTQALFINMLEHARTALPETQDPTIKLVGAFYASCMSDTDLDSITTTLAAQRSVWCRNATEETLQNAFFHTYIQTVMPPEKQKLAETMVANLKTAARKRLEGASWLSDDTKHSVTDKLSKLHVTIAYPTHWIDYSALTLSPTDFRQNQKAIADFAWKQQISMIGGAEGVGALALQPYAVNALYNPAEDAMEVPAVMLQPPFFDAIADDALNYGASGVVIGHEIMHGYDNYGRLYGDPWTPAEVTVFDQKTEAFATQVSTASQFFPGIGVDGKATLGENIADLSGMLIAYDALEQTLEGKPRTLIEGMTQEQRFFLALARLWRTKPIQEISSGDHAAPIVRVNMMLRNMPMFAKAYGCKAGDPMVATPVVQIW